MTDNKAIEIIKREKQWESDASISKAFNMAIQALEENQVLKEKLENAKEDIRKLLCSEYGSSCQFCIQDENEDAMCCNIGGSGSWCCKNARWKER